MNFKFNAYWKANSGSYKSRKLVSMNLLGEQHIRRVFSEQVIFKQGLKDELVLAHCVEKRVDSWSGGEHRWGWKGVSQRKIKSDLEGPKAGMLDN